MLRTFIWALILLLGVNDLYGNHVNKDSISIKNLINKAVDSSATNVSIAHQLLSLAANKAQEKTLPELQADALFEDMVLFFQDGQYEHAIQYCQQAASLYISVKNKKKEAKCYSAMGLIYQYLGDYSSSLKTLFKGLKIAQATNDMGVIGPYYTNISIAYQDIGDWKNMFLYVQKSIDLNKKLKNISGLAKNYNNMATAYNEMKDFPNAVKYYKMAIANHRKSGNTALAISSTSNLVGLYVNLKNIDSAYYYSNIVMQYAETHQAQNFSDYCYAVTNHGYILLLKDKIEEAKEYKEKCNSCKPLLGSYSFALNYYSFMTLYYKKIGDLKTSLENMELLSQIKDSVAVESQNFENQRIAVKYDYEQKAKEDSLQYQLNLSKQKLKTATYKSSMYLLLAALLTITGIAILINREIRKKQELKRKQELEKMRNNIAGDLHDEIGSTLSSIQIISTMMSQQNTENPKLKEAANTISRLSNKVANGIREIVWSVNPANDHLNAILTQMHKIASEILSSAEIQLLFKKELHDPEIIILPQIRKDLILFFKEAVNNARKYSQSIQVDIMVLQEDARLHLTIKDYGVGFDMQEVARGNGLNNMERRAANLNGELSFDSQKSRGTTIRLSVPIS